MGFWKKRLRFPLGGKKNSQEGVLRGRKTPPKKKKVPKQLMAKSQEVWMTKKEFNEGGGGGFRKKKRERGGGGVVLGGNVKTGTDKLRLLKKKKHRRKDFQEKGNAGRKQSHWEYEKSKRVEKPQSNANLARPRRREIALHLKKKHRKEERISESGNPVMRRSRAAGVAAQSPIRGSPFGGKKKKKKKKKKYIWGEKPTGRGPREGEGGKEGGRGHNGMVPFCRKFFGKKGYC